MSIALVLDPEGIAVAATAAAAGLVYSTSALRPSCLESAAARAVVGVVAFALATVVITGRLQPVVAYAAICLSMTLVYVVDLIHQERLRRRRVASLTPRPLADRVPATWTFVAALSAAMVIPYLIDNGIRGEALIVGACVLAMAGTAWRVASAPLQLVGDDPEGERSADRASRARRTGITAVLAVGTVFVFANFVTPTLGTETPLEHLVRVLAFPLWVGLLLWSGAYVWRLDRKDAKAS